MHKGISSYSFITRGLQCRVHFAVVQGGWTKLSHVSSQAARPGIAGAHLAIEIPSVHAPTTPLAPVVIAAGGTLAHVNATLQAVLNKVEVSLKALVTQRVIALLELVA